LDGNATHARKYARKYVTNAVNPTDVRIALSSSHYKPSCLSS